MDVIETLCVHWYSEDLLRYLVNRLILMIIELWPLINIKIGFHAITCKSVL